MSQLTKKHRRVAAEDLPCSPCHFWLRLITIQVARTRLRQAPLQNGHPKYTGLIQCFKLVWLEEGLMGLYGGLTPHLMRTVPSAAIMFGMYEGILRLMNTRS